MFYIKSTNTQTGESIYIGKNSRATDPDYLFGYYQKFTNAEKACQKEYERLYELGITGCTLKIIEF